MSGSDLETHSCSLVYHRDRYTIIYYSETCFLPPTPFVFVAPQSSLFSSLFSPPLFGRVKKLVDCFIHTRPYQLYPSIPFSTLPSSKPFLYSLPLSLSSLYQFPHPRPPLLLQSQKKIYLGRGWIDGRWRKEGSGAERTGGYGGKMGWRSGGSWGSFMNRGFPSCNDVVRGFCGAGVLVGRETLFRILYICKMFSRRRMYV